MSANHNAYADLSVADLEVEFDASRRTATERRTASFRSAHRREDAARRLSGLAKLAIGAALVGLLVAVAIVL